MKQLEIKRLGLDYFEIYREGDRVGYIEKNHRGRWQLFRLAADGVKYIRVEAFHLGWSNLADVFAYIDSREDTLKLKKEEQKD